MKEWTLIFQENEYSEAYKSFTNFYSRYSDMKHPLVDYVEF